MGCHPDQTACHLSDVLDGIALSAKTPTSLRQALAFRAVELSLILAPRERAQGRIVEQVGLLFKEETGRGMQFTPLNRGPDPLAKQMPDARNRGSRAGGGEVSPTLASATVERQCPFLEAQSRWRCPT